MPNVKVPSKEENKPKPIQPLPPATKNTDTKSVKEPAKSLPNANKEITNNTKNVVSPPIDIPEDKNESKNPQPQTKKVETPVNTKLPTKITPDAKKVTDPAVPMGGDKKIHTKIASPASIHGSNSNESNNPDGLPELSSGDSNSGSTSKYLADVPVQTVVIYLAPFVAISLFVMIMWVFKRKRSTRGRVGSMLKNRPNNSTIHTTSIINTLSITNSLSDENSEISDEKLYMIGNGKSLEEIEEEYSHSNNKSLEGEEEKFTIPVYSLGTGSELSDTHEKDDSHDKKGQRGKKGFKHIFSKKKSRLTTKNKNHEKPISIAIMNNQTELPAVENTQFSNDTMDNQKITLPLPAKTNKSQKYNIKFYQENNNNSTSPLYNNNPQGTNGSDNTMLNSNTQGAPTHGVSNSKSTLTFTAKSDQTIVTSGNTLKSTYSTDSHHYMYDIDKVVVQNKSHENLNTTPPRTDLKTEENENNRDSLKTNSRSLNVYDQSNKIPKVYRDSQNINKKLSMEEQELFNYDVW